MLASRMASMTNEDWHGATVWLTDRRLHRRLMLGAAAVGDGASDHGACGGEGRVSWHQRSKHVFGSDLPATGITEQQLE